MTTKQNLTFLALKTAVEEKLKMVKRWKSMAMDPQCGWTDRQREVRFNRRDKLFHADNKIIAAAVQFIKSHERH